ncbi:MAG TPA: orotidine-5'-phosphate decarboxylase, partial [Anaeromyxobacter sp.]|nr:orotidine-5'-phosphate decarboxylase [Anaeromyxobacter sp.]
MNLEGPLCAALDFPTWREAEPFARAVAPAVGVLKVGLELFAAEGPSAVGAAAALGRPVFLDLKLHDIPNTVAGAARSAARSGASLLTVHASGGAEMVRAAVRGAGSGVTVLAVTVLTSLDGPALDAVGLAGPPEAAVVRLARLAVDAGAGGLVCSPHEVAAVRAAVGGGPLLVVPGVRPAGAARGDQARVATPAEA